ncbi:MAG TPA: phytanoyl-CoA dioxygenase family protein [Methylomirabilota bacterium]|nr:phytanoyl-CoA dioxygenase family protein [Methylomirabilota bacterium]
MSRPARPARFFLESALAAYRRDGFLVCRGLLGPEAVADVRRWTEEIQAWPETPGAWMVYGEPSLREPGRRLVNRIENFYPYHPGFEALFDGDLLLGRVADLLGEPAVLFKDKINFKLPGGDGFKPHQDQQAGWSAYAPLFVTALVAIDDATEANGCLELAAGHHTRGLIGREWAPLEGPDLEGVTFVPCPAAPGDVVFFDSYVPHRSGPNLSDDPRRVLYVTYNRLADGDQRARYYADKRRSFPPDVEREPGRQYVYRV